MAQWVKALAVLHEERGLDLQHTWQCWVGTCNLGT